MIADEIRPLHSLTWVVSAIAMFLGALTRFCIPRSVVVDRPVVGRARVVRFRAARAVRECVEHGLRDVLAALPLGIARRHHVSSPPLTALRMPMAVIGGMVEQVPGEVTKVPPVGGRP